MSLANNTAALEELLKQANNLPDAGEGPAPIIEALTVTENGTYTAPDGVDGYSPVTVNVPVPDGYIVPSGELEVTENGTHDVTEYAAVKVNVAASGDDETLIKLIDRTITEITMPSDLTQIGKQAFYNCAKLVTAKLHEGITKIGDYAFYGCSKLALTKLPDSVTWLGSSTFNGCTGLAITEIPSSVTSIGATAFRNCTGLTSITFKGTPTSINANSFTGCTNLLTINVPWAEGAVANAPWGATNATINYNYTEE